MIKRDHRCVDGERAIATVFVALLLVPLVAFAGMAVDLGGWYARAAQIQRAADAAALAGVTKLTEGVGEAEDEARRVATLNGFTDGIDGIQVDVDPIPALQQLKVTITDTDVPQYLTKLFRPSVSIARQGQAEQVLPVPMGSPRNYLGTGDLLAGSANDERLFAAISGYCASREQGDRIMPRSDASFDSASNPPPPSGNDFASCEPGSPSHVVENPEFDANGYYYAVEVPVGYSGSLDIQVFDAPYCARPWNGNGPRDQSGAFTTRFRVLDNNSLDPAEANQLSSVDLPGEVMGSGLCATPDINATTSNGAQCGASQWGNCWRTLHTIGSPVEPGVYFVQVQALAPGSFDEQEGTNGFGLRTRQNGSFTPCSGDPFSTSPAYSSSCPNVFAVEHLGLFARIGGAGEFFLAEVGPQHNGKTMEIVLWDTGEGAENLRIIDPAGDTDSYPFTWEVLCLDGSEAPCPGETAPTGGRGPFTGQTVISNLDDNNAPQPGPHRLSSYRYNDRLIRVRLQLPDDINAAFGGRTWWRIRYQAGSAATDRTTWSVTIKGDPVRLVPNT